MWTSGRPVTTWSRSRAQTRTDPGPHGTALLCLTLLPTACFLARVIVSARRRTLARVAVSGLALVGALGLAEVLTRRLALLDRLNGFPRHLFLATSMPDLPYRLRPGVTLHIRDFTVRVNELGLRGEETTERPPPGKRRLLVLGDSIVYGEGLAEADTFPVLLQQELARRGRADVEVLNGGASGYDTPAELAYLREFGLRLTPDTVVVGVSLNDYESAPGITPVGFLTIDPAARDGAPWLSNHSEYYVLVRWLVRYARGGHWFQQAAAGAKPRADGPHPAPGGLDRAIGLMHRHFYTAKDPAKWERVRRALEGIRDTARAKGLDLAFVIFPEGWQVGVPDPDLEAQRAWLGLCAEAGVRCLDLYPAFAAAGSEPLFQDTQHPNAVGMRIAARAAGEYLAQ